MLRSTESSTTSEVTLRVCNSNATALRVLWCNHGGEEVEYAVLLPGQAYNQSTYSTHAWRLRDVPTGRLIFEYVGETVTISVEGGGRVATQPGLCFDTSPASAPTHPDWGIYRTRAFAFGIPIKAYDCVGDDAVALATRALECMLADVDASIVSQLCQRGAELAIIGRNQVTSDIPAHIHLKGRKCTDEERTVDEGTRGLGGNPATPTTSVGEENLTMVGDRHYPSESILVHEFAHAVMDIGLGKEQRGAILQAYESAKARGLHDPASYLMLNASEYWAEGTQAWFEATVRTDVTSGMTCREHVKERDPELASVLAAVYGDGPWRYPYTAPRQFAPAAGALPGLRGCHSVGPDGVIDAGHSTQPCEPEAIAIQIGCEGRAATGPESAGSKASPVRRGGRTPWEAGGRGREAAALLTAGGARRGRWLLGRLLASCRSCIRRAYGGRAGGERHETAGRQEQGVGDASRGSGLWRSALSVLKRAGIRSGRPLGSPKGQ